MQRTNGVVSYNFLVAGYTVDVYIALGYTVSLGSISVVGSVTKLRNSELKIGLVVNAELILVSEELVLTNGALVVCLETGGLAAGLYLRTDSAEYVLVGCNVDLACEIVNAEGILALSKRIESVKIATRAIVVVLFALSYTVRIEAFYKLPIVTKCGRYEVGILLIDLMLLTYNSNSILTYCADVVLIETGISAGCRNSIIMSRTLYVRTYHSVVLCEEGLLAVGAVVVGKLRLLALIKF